MVRLKHRYLLLQILYPSTSNTDKNPKTEHEYALQLHRPTPDTLTPPVLARAVRDAVGEMYGDWGVGKLGGSSGVGVGGTFFLVFSLRIHLF